MIDDQIKPLAYKVEQPRNPWISVDERLPEKAIGKSERSEYVLCRHKNGSYYVAYWHVGLEYWYSMPYKIDKSNITHWMPIPQLPIEERLIAGLQELNEHFKKGE